MFDLFISDIDGTLLRNDATLSGYAFTALTRMLENGLPFTVATARSVVSARQVLGDLPISLPVIEFNGAYISDFKTGRHLVVNAIDPLLYPDIVSVIRSHKSLPFISAYDGRRDSLYYESLPTRGMRAYFDHRRAFADNRLRDPVRLEECFGEQIVCFTVMDDENTLHDIQTVLRGRHNHHLSFHLFKDMYSDSYWLTINAKQATKDRAISTMRTMAGLQEHRLTVFGDHLNDLPMFKIADAAVAVSNAEPEVKAIATEIIGTNMEDSVVKYIERAFVRKDC